MIKTNAISPAVIEETEKGLLKDPAAKKVHDLYTAITEKESELFKLQVELLMAEKAMPAPTIKWRESIKWCLEIDSKNPRYFLKTSSGVYQCIAFKHSIEVTADIRNKIASTLSAMFMEKELIGRISYNNTLYYGLAEFFKENLTELKDEYINMLDGLIV